MEFKQGDLIRSRFGFMAGRRQFKAGVIYWITATHKSHSSTVQPGSVIVGSRKRDQIGQGICLRIEDLAKLVDKL